MADAVPTAMPDVALAEPPRPLHGRWLVLGLVLAAGVLVAASVPRWLERMPHVPERLPAPVQDVLRQLVREPDWAALPHGPWLDAVRARGELVVGVRQYVRPAPPGRPTPPEPDAFDVSLARFVAERLQVRLRVVGLSADGRETRFPGVDMTVAGAMGGNVPTAYLGGGGALVALRNSDYRQPEDLRQRAVCVAQGSPYAQALRRTLGAVPRVYASSIRAVAGFMAGECQALADDAQVVARLMGLPEWRFYRRIEGTLAPDNAGAQIAVRTDDPADVAWLDRAVRQWKIGGAFAEARERRAGDVAYEAVQLGDGLVCHS